MRVLLRGQQRGGRWRMRVSFCFACVSALHVSLLLAEQQKRSYLRRCECFTLAPLPSDAGCIAHTRMWLKLEPPSDIESAPPFREKQEGGGCCGCWSWIEMMWGWLSKQDQIIHALTIKQQVKYSWKSSACWACSNTSIWDAHVFLCADGRARSVRVTPHLLQKHSKTHTRASHDIFARTPTHPKKVWSRACWWFVKQRLYMEAGQRSCGRVRGVSQCNSLWAPTPFRHAAWSSVTPPVRVSLCGNVLYDCFASCILWFDLKLTERTWRGRDCSP